MNPVCSLRMSSAKTETLFKKKDEIITFIILCVVKSLY